MKKTGQINFVASANGYNVCPRCGRPAYEIATEDQMYHVGCLYCGLQYGVGLCVEEEITEGITEALRIRWNEQYLTDVHFSEEVLEILKMGEADYLLVNNLDKSIICSVETAKEVKRYVKERNDIPIGIYKLVSGYPQYMGHSYFVSELEK